jgi:hypothetical protein
MMLRSWPRDSKLEVTQIGELCDGWPSHTVQKTLLHVMLVYVYNIDNINDILTLFMFLWWPKNMLIL